MTALPAVSLFYGEASCLEARNEERSIALHFIFACSYRLLPLEGMHGVGGKIDLQHDGIEHDLRSLLRAAIRNHKYVLSVGVRES